MGLEPLEEKWSAFGWHVVSLDGNSMEELVAAFEAVPSVHGKPTLIMANTIKGKGVSFAENVALWHHHVPNDAELEQALRELTAAKESAMKEKEVQV
ncbi:transketolase [compost metagenome]